MINLYGKLVRNTYLYADLHDRRRMGVGFQIDFIFIHAEVVTRVAGSLEAEGLPGYPESLFVEINVMKS